MSKGWLAIVAVLVACGSRRDEPPDPGAYDGERLRREFLAEQARQARQEPQARQLAPVLVPSPVPAVVPAPVPPPPPDPPRPATQPPPRSCLDSGSLLHFHVGSVLAACFDRNNDGTADRCARWRLDGKPIDYDPAIDDVDIVEHTDGPSEPAAFHSDSEHNDESRIELDGGTVQICPYDRACLKLMPRVGDEHAIGAVLTDAEYRRAAISLHTHDNQRGHVELWDLERGRAYAKLPFRGLMRDADYTFSVRLGRGALVALAEHGSDGTVSGAIYGLDGGVRGMLAGGARALDLAGAIETSGQFVILEEQPDGRPYLLHGVDLATGAASGRYVIARADDTAPKAEVSQLSPGVIGVVQWGQQLRLDVIDVRRRAQRTLRAPGC